MKKCSLTENRREKKSQVGPLDTQSHPIVTDKAGQPLLGLDQNLCSWCWAGFVLALPARAAVGHSELAESLWVWRTGSSKYYVDVLRMKLLVQKAKQWWFWQWCGSYSHIHLWDDPVKQNSWLFLFHQRLEVTGQPDSGQEENRYKDKTTSGHTVQCVFSIASSFIEITISLMIQK